MSSLDINIMDVNGDGSLSFTISPRGSRAVGVKKVLQIWVKEFYSFVEESLSGNDGADVVSVVNLAVSMASQAVKGYQDGRSIPDDEKFKSCSIKNLDTGLKDSRYILSVAFATYSTEKILEL